MGKSKQKRLAIIVTIISIILIVSSCVSANLIKNTFKNEDLSDITIQIFGIKDVEDHIFQLTSEEINILKQSFGDLEEQLDNSESREERINLFKEMIISLYNLGLIPEGINVEDLQQLVTTEIIKSKNTLGENENFNCFIAGNTDETIFFKSWLLNGCIAFGNTGTQGYPLFFESKGWVYTDGLKGVVKFNGGLSGRIRQVIIDERYRHIGATGFTGIGITNGLIHETLNSMTWFLGTANKVKIWIWQTEYKEDVVTNGTETLKVHIMDQKGKNIPFASVTVSWPYGFDKKPTNLKGEARFSISPPAKVHISASKLFASASVNVNLEENLPLTVNITLNRLKTSMLSEFLSIIFFQHFQCI
jgi:hypothetical protein